MMWDRTHLYLAARMESDREVRATYTERNSPIFHEDSDFEAFVDPAGSNASYKEMEVNALGTVWNLLLDRPYADGGTEHSGRVASPGDGNRYWDAGGQAIAARVVEGRANVAPPPPPSDGGFRVVWEAEVALAHSDTLARHPWGERPEVGGRWRINFSRVEEGGGVNWTWQPQRTWDPGAGRHSGHVDMHRPDAWGYVVFAGPDGGDGGGGGGGGIPPPEVRDPDWPARLAAMNVYYAQAAHLEASGAYAGSVGELGGLVDPAIVGPFLGGMDIDLVAGEDGEGAGYRARVRSVSRVVCVTDRRLLTVEDAGAEDGDGDGNGDGDGVEAAVQRY